MSLDEVIRDAFVSAFSLPPHQFSDSLSPEEVSGWDSLGHLRLVTELQARLGIELEIDEIMQMENVTKIKDILRKRGFDS